MKHLCAQTGCLTLVPTGYLMCVRHWRMVPAEVRRVWRQTINERDLTPAWREAALANLDEMRRIVGAIEHGVRP